MTIRVGIIGAGNISETHARVASEIEGVKIAAVYGQNRKRAAQLAERYECAAFDDLDMFLKHRPMEVVAIGSPSGLHAEHGIAAARHNLHALVEKPIDISTERADALISECEKAGVKLGVFFQDRMATDLCKLKEMIEAGRLSKPFLVSARVKWHRGAEYYSNSRWRGTTALDGGGALINQGIHTVDLMLWLMGDVSRVYAKGITALHRIEVEDTLVATMEFESGAIGTLEATTAAYPGYPRCLELTGAEGTITIEHDRIISADLRSPIEDLKNLKEHDSNAAAVSPVVSDTRGHKRIFEDFLKAIETGSIPRCDGREGRRSVKVVEAIYQSSSEGRAVRL
jgi:predicted dehydrogenase